MHAFCEPQGSQGSWSKDPLPLFSTLPLSFSEAMAGMERYGAPCSIRIFAKGAVLVGMQVSGSKQWATADYQLDTPEGDLQQVS